MSEKLVVKGAVDLSLSEPSMKGRLALEFLSIIIYDVANGLSIEKVSLAGDCVDNEVEGVVFVQD